MTYFYLPFFSFYNCLKLLKHCTFKTASAVIMFLLCFVHISNAGARAACGAGEGGHGCPCDASLQWGQI